ncbi:MAG TPA: hypothetical protein VD996_13540 [Chitinophagaceae bacterium]|nr:hypothetical protein [Chitinophagaceae bacterium]
MVKYISALILVMIGLHASGQVVINVQLPASNIYLKNQLWNLSVVNAGATEPTVRVELLLTDVSSNQPILSGISGVLRLKKGVTQINSLSASPLTYNILNAGYNIDANPGGFLPVGFFNVCFRVLAVGEVSERLAEECDVIEIEPLSPPQLILPFDQDTVHLTRPLFVWAAPAPQIFLASAPLYDLALVEVMPSQTSADAIQQNMPVYFQSGISTTAHPYPASSPELDTARLYAWQITVRNNVNVSMAKSEIWTFRVQKQAHDTAVVTNGQAYSRLSRSNAGSVTIAKGQLSFVYYNELNEASVKIRIYDISSSYKAVHLDSPVCAMRFGQNLVQYNLPGNGNFIDKHVYLLELVNGRNETWYLKFQYRQPE